MRQTSETSLSFGEVEAGVRGQRDRPRDGARLNDGGWYVVVLLERWLKCRCVV
jgi:hypothetical protein